MMTRYRGRGDLLHLLTVHLLAVDGSGGRSGRRRLAVHLLLGTVRILLLLLLAVDGSDGCGDVRRSRRLTVRGSGCAIHLGGGGGGGGGGLTVYLMLLLTESLSSVNVLLLLSSLLTAAAASIRAAARHQFMHQPNGRFHAPGFARNLAH